MTHPIVQNFLKDKMDAGGTIHALELEVERLQKRVAELEAAQQSVHADPPSACEDCGSVDEHIHYANCPLANTAGNAAANATVSCFEVK